MSDLCTATTAGGPCCQPLPCQTHPAGRDRWLRDHRMTTHVHPECLAAIRAHLDAGYVEHYERAERMYAAGKPKNARVNRRFAVACGWASGWIKGMAG